MELKYEKTKIFYIKFCDFQWNLFASASFVNAQVLIILRASFSIAFLKLELELNPQCLIFTMLKWLWTALILKHRPRGGARALQNKHSKGSNYYNRKLFRYFWYKFFDVEFLFLRVSYRKCHCRWSIKYARPFLVQQNIHSGK